MTASFVRAKAKLDPELPRCEFFENLDIEDGLTLPKGVYNLVSFWELGGG